MPDTEKLPSVMRLRAFLLAACALGYFLVECLYCFQLPLVMDEFANAKHIARVFESIPYRDYSPYKGILGYLIQAPALYLVGDPWWSLIAVKLQMAAMVALCLFGLGVWLCRRYGDWPALAALLLLVSQNTFLERSADLRVDMLASLAGTAIVIALLEKRIIVAGALAGMAVLITQKAAYFPVAGGMALLAQFLAERSRLSLQRGFVFVGVALAVFGTYVLIAMLLGGVDVVVKSLFTSPAGIAFDQLYPGAIRQFWGQTLSRNLVPYVLAGAGLVMLLIRARREPRARLLGVFSTVLLLECIWHKQPWPYFFVFLIPTCAIVTAAGLSQLRLSRVARGVIAGLVLLASAYSFVIRMPKVFAQDSRLQQETIRAAAAIVGPGDYYFAGVELLWQRRHVPALPWLDAPRRKYYENHPREALDLIQAGPKPRLVIDNYRVRALPSLVRGWLGERYSTQGGGLFLLTASIVRGEQEVDFGSGGLFRVQPGLPVTLRLEDRLLGSGQTALVPAGIQTVTADGSARIFAWSMESDFLLTLGQPRQPFFWPAYTY